MSSTESAVLVLDYDNSTAKRPADPGQALSDVLKALSRSFATQYDRIQVDSGAVPRNAPTCEAYVTRLKEVLDAQDDWDGSNGDSLAEGSAIMAAEAGRRVSCRPKSLDNTLIEWSTADDLRAAISVDQENMSISINRQAMQYEVDRLPEFQAGCTAFEAGSKLPSSPTVWGEEDVTERMMAQFEAAQNAWDRFAGLEEENEARSGQRVTSGPYLSDYSVQEIRSHHQDCWSELDRIDRSEPRIGHGRVRILAEKLSASLAALRTGLDQHRDLQADYERLPQLNVRAHQTIKTFLAKLPGSYYGEDLQIDEELFERRREVVSTGIEAWRSLNRIRLIRKALEGPEAAPGANAQVETNESIATTKYGHVLQTWHDLSQAIEAIDKGAAAMESLGDRSDELAGSLLDSLTVFEKWKPEIHSFDDAGRNLKTS